MNCWEQTASLLRQWEDDFSISGTSPDFTKEEFLAHSQIRINETLNEYGREYSDDPLGVGGLQFVKTKGEAIAEPYEYTTMVEVERADDPSDKHFMVHSYYNKRPNLSVFKEAEAISGNGTNLIEYAATENRLRIFVADTTNFEQGRSLMLAGDTGLRGDLNGRSLVISSVTPQVAGSNGLGANAGYIDVSTSGLAVADENFNITVGTATNIFALTSPAASEPTMEAFFEGTSPVYEGAKEIYSSQKIVMREINSSSSNTTHKGAFVVKDWKINNTADEINNVGGFTRKTNLSWLTKLSQATYCYRAGSRAC